MAGGQALICLDTNLLVYAHRSATPQHRAARRAVERAVNHTNGWGLALPSVTEFWSVVTHPSARGRPSRPEEAAAFLASLVNQGGARLFSPGPGFGQRLLELAVQLGICGPRVFDLQIALAAFDHGAVELWTHDAGFVAFPGLRVVNPLVTGSGSLTPTPAV